MITFSCLHPLRCARWGALAVAICVASTGTAAGQPSSESTGFYLYERFDATRNTLGFITRIDSTAGYNFNRYFALDAGVPLYLVRPSETALTSATIARANDIGNVHLTARINAVTPAITYLGTFTATAPTGDKNKGLGTGRATYDWNNHLERSFGRLTPFGEAGVANTVADTPFFIRPFTSQGLVAHFEGGLRLSLAPRVSVEGSLYTIEPSGEQTVISRVTPSQAPSSPAPPNRGQGMGRGHKQGVFELAQTTVGPAEIARDRGGSVWLSLGPFSVLDFQLGYSRSATYALDTVFFGAGLNLGSLIKKGRL